MDDKNINLMPEDLRSKESDVLHKSKKDFDLDLVLPEGKRQVGKAEKKSGPGWWSSLTKMFKSKKPPILKPEPIKEFKLETDKKPEEKKLVLDKKVKHEDKMHVPHKDKHKEKELKQDFFAVESNGKAEKKSGPSWWDQLKEIFKSNKPKKEKPKKPAVVPKPEKKEKPKVELVAPPKVETVKPKMEKPLKPEIKPQQPEVKPEPKPVEPPKTEPKPEVKPKPDFALPHTEQPMEETDKKEPVKKFHQPKPLIRAKFISEGGGVDLIPQSARTRSWRQVLNLLLITLIGSVIIIAIFYVVLFIQGENKKAQQLNKAQQISNLEEQILTYRDLNEEIEALGEEIKLTYSVINQHIYWTNFFEMLEKYTVSEVYYTGLSAGQSGALTLDAMGASYGSVARQLKLLQQPEAQEFVTDVDISGAAANETGVSFSISLILNQDLFYYDNNEDGS